MHVVAGAVLAVVVLLQQAGDPETLGRLRRDESRERRVRVLVSIKHNGRQAAAGFFLDPHGHFARVRTVIDRRL